jgi:hypothetical protein
MEKCPKCNSSKGVREILYGFPAEPIDERKYKVGGCCISDNDPTLSCQDCGWEGEYADNLSNFDIRIK